MNNYWSLILRALPQWIKKFSPDGDAVHSRLSISRLQEDL